MTFTITLGGTAVSVMRLTYKIKDIDGLMAWDGRGSGERLHVSAGYARPPIPPGSWVRGRARSGLVVLHDDADFETASRFLTDVRAQRV
ncbi:MAG: hypothetical protein WA971_11995 [Microbacterium sp.]